MTIDWQPIDPLLDDLSVEDISEKFGASRSAIYKRRAKLGLTKSKSIEWEPIDPLLGTATDREIAEKVGILQCNISSRRIKLGIPAYTPKTKWNWKLIDPLLGTATDPEIGERFGIPAKSVCNRRSRLGIAAYTPKPPPPNESEQKLAKARLSWAKMTLTDHATPDFCQCSFCEMAGTVLDSGGFCERFDVLIF